MTTATALRECETLLEHLPTGVCADDLLERVRKVLRDLGQETQKPSGRFWPSIQANCVRDAVRGGRAMKKRFNVERNFGRVLLRQRPELIS